MSVALFKRIVIASDHGGFKLKGALRAHLEGAGYDVIDVGTHTSDSTDYPLYARAAAEAIATGRAERGIIIDGAGIGSAMVANKVDGVRAGMAYNVATAVNAAEHNGAHLLTLGAGYLDVKTAIEIVDTFLNRECTVDRHLRRIEMIDAIDGAVLIENRAESMSQGNQSSSDHERLVQAITRVLVQNPTMMGKGAPGTVCTTCNTCDSQCVSSAPQAVKTLMTCGATRISSQPGETNVDVDMASMIDHTLLKANASYADIDQLCEEAKVCGFASVCVNPVHVKRCADKLRWTKVKVCTVVGFPLGANAKEIKAMEGRRALRDGAQELDMVINIGALKSGDLQAVFQDIRLLAEVVRGSNALLKVIIETALLTDEEKVTACVLAKKAGAHFVKTSTGFSTGGATTSDVVLMARAVDHKLEVKASGGIKSSSDAVEMVAAGATRIGASVGIKISGCEMPAGNASAY